MLKTAIITDIHGNFPALRAVMEALNQEDGLDHIFVLGDMIGIGPYSNEVLDLLFSQKRITMLSGNHDESVLALLNDKEYPASHIKSKAHHQWIAERLQPAFLEQLASLPRKLDLTIADHKVLLCHYHIEKNKLSVPISQDPFSTIVDPSLFNLQQLFHDHQDSLIGFGHHHPHHYFKDESTIFLNPGSLGCTKNDLAPFAIVTFEKETISVEIKYAQYDKSAFLASYEKLQVPDRDFILKVFHGVGS